VFSGRDICLYDHPHYTILFTGNERLIEFNEIDHIALETGDVGRRRVAPAGLMRTSA
jgi:hypothetical protein